MVRQMLFDWLECMMDFLVDINIWSSKMLPFEPIFLAQAFRFGDFRHLLRNNRSHRSSKRRHNSELFRIFVSFFHLVPNPLGIPRIFRASYLFTCSEIAPEILIHAFYPVRYLELQSCSIWLHFKKAEKVSIQSIIWEFRKILQRKSSILRLTQTYYFFL